MTAEQATAALLEAIEAGDLGAISRALAARQQAIDGLLATGQEMPPQALEQGELAHRRILALQQSWAAENARLRQIQLGFGTPPEQNRSCLRGLL
jgi:hypothetical protein